MEKTRMKQETAALRDRITAGYRLTYDEAVALAAGTPTDELCALAGSLREHFGGKRFDTCSIMNARSGRCSEDCKWCSQSKFHRTDIDVYPLVGEAETLEMALYNDRKGIRRFSLVTSGRAMSDAEIERSCRIFEAVASQTGLSLCASMGLLNKEQLAQLRRSGVERYHCNLETAPSYFPELCSTHTTEEKIRTIRWAQEAGMQVCSGGIIGMGESMEQRIELAVTLRDLGIRSVPLNVLNPIKGTKLENIPALGDDEALKSFAIFRIINPEADLRFAGGRILIKHLERRLLHSGVSASIMGDMLTTSGSEIDRDKEMLAEEGFTI